MSKHINDFQQLLTSHFRELVLATAYLEIGHNSIKQSPPNASISLTLADGITTEPMFLCELKPHSASVSLGIAELFQTKAVAAWSDLLNTLYEFFIAMHVDGTQHFPAFKKRSTRLDFTSTEDLITQVRRGLVADFAFAKYSERIQTICRVLVPPDRLQQELSTVRKHVAIRNATQHHAGRVYDEMLRDLGSVTLEVLNHAGRAVELQQDQPIALYVPELDRLKSSLFIITNEWRDQLATYSNGSNT